MDECSISFKICGNGVCINTPGSFKCECQEGYETMPPMETCMGKLIKFNNWWAISSFLCLFVI